jgi:hypothetical protein
MSFRPSDLAGRMARDGAIEFTMRRLRTAD